MEIEDLRHSEIEKMVGQLVYRFEPKNVDKPQSDKKIKSCSMEEIRRIYPREYEKWTIEEDQQLIDEYKQGKFIPQLAIKHQRKTETIRSRLKKLGLVSE